MVVTRERERNVLMAAAGNGRRVDDEMDSGMVWGWDRRRREKKQLPRIKGVVVVVVVVLSRSHPEAKHSRLTSSRNVTVSRPSTCVSNSMNKRRFDTGDDE